MKHSGTKTRDEMLREAYLERTLPELHRNNISILDIYRPRSQSGKGASYVGKVQKQSKTKKKTNENRTR